MLFLLCSKKREIFACWYLNIFLITKKNNITLNISHDINNFAFIYCLLLEYILYWFKQVSLLQN